MNLRLADMNVAVTGVADSPFFDGYRAGSVANRVDLEIAITPELVDGERELAGQPRYSDEYLAQMALLRQLAECGPRLGCFLMHMAVVDYDGKAYAFAAPSGTGKSTHVRLWRRALGNAVTVINGDKPIVRLDQDASRGSVFYVYGTPWAGKEGWQTNTSAPLAGICLLGRGDHDACRRISPQEGLERIARQTYMPQDGEAALQTFVFLDVLLREVPLFELTCTMNMSAARASLEAMCGLDFDQCSGGKTFED